MLGLVLGGGGAKGYAHIGVIKCLEELAIKPEIIVGASMGSLVGGFYASGYTGKKMEEIALSIDKKKKRWLFPLHLSKKGLIDGERVIKFLSSYIGGIRIEQLSIEYAAVAADIETSEEIVINQGDLVQAIRASISIPLAFVPHYYAGRVLIDGGFPNPVPISVAEKMGAKKIIAVNVLTKPEYPQVLISSRKHSNSKTYNMKTVLEKTFDIISSRLIDFETSKSDKFILINVDTTGIDISHFEKARLAIKRGYDEVYKNAEKLKVFTQQSP